MDFVLSENHVIEEIFKFFFCQYLLGKPSKKISFCLVFSCPEQL